MAKINNQAVIQKLIDELQLYPALDLIPTELAEKILPVFQINTQEVNVSFNSNLQKASQVTPNTNNQTLTVPDDQRWKIKSLMMKYSATATGGNRILTIKITDRDGDLIWRAILNLAITANVVKNIFFVDASPWDTSKSSTSIIDLQMVGEIAGDQNQDWFIPVPINSMILEEGTLINIVDDSNVDTLDDIEIHTWVDVEDTS